MTKTIYEGRIITLALEEATLPDGRRQTVEVAHHPGGACAVPVHDDGTVLLLRQFRAAVGEFLWEIPAGKLDVAGEDPCGCAARELVEEAGVRADRLEEVACFYTTPGFCDEVLTVFRATGLTPAEAAPEEHEIIEVHRFAPDAIAAMIRRGEIRDAKTLIGLFACGFGS